MSGRRPLDQACKQDRRDSAGIEPPGPEQVSELHDDIEEGYLGRSKEELSRALRCIVRPTNSV